ILKTDVLIEVQAEIDALEKLIAKKTSTDLENELEYMLDIKKFYNEALALIEKGKLTQKEATNILLDLEDMRADDEDEI
ncbi:MAG: hypothetical protein DI602_07075, partial [Aliarcobacter butzleri]